MKDITKEQGDQYREAIDTRRKQLKQAFTPEVFKILEERFQINLPCFQGSIGQYDPLDAMRRDAHREIILWIKNEISKITQDNQ